MSDEDFKRVLTWLWVAFENEEELYSFNLDELKELEKYLKSKVFGQDEIIEKYINHFMLNTYRTKNNERNLWVFFNFWPSWTWKNFLMELIAEKLWFWIYVIDNSQNSSCEASTFLGATDWYSSNEKSIFESINDIAKETSWKMLVLIDEQEKAIDSNNSDLNTFFTAIMNIINNKVVYTKNNSTKINLSNYIFVFNSNLWFDDYNEDTLNKNKIWFDVDNTNKIVENTKKVDTKYIENYFKKELKINISVFNRLKTWDNFFFFNNLNKKHFDDYLNKKFKELKIELSYNLWIEYKKLPNLDHYKDKIKSFDYSRWFRWIDQLLYNEIKLDMMTNYIFKNKIRLKK